MTYEALHQLIFSDIPSYNSPFPCCVPAILVSLNLVRARLVWSLYNSRSFCLQLCPTYFHGWLLLSLMSILLSKLPCVQNKCYSHETALRHPTIGNTTETTVEIWYPSLSLQQSHALAEILRHTHCQETYNSPDSHLQLEVTYGLAKPYTVQQSMIPSPKLPSSLLHSGLHLHQGVLFPQLPSAPSLISLTEAFALVKILHI